MLERPISKSGWTRVAFGDVVRLSKARAADPETAGFERVVGLEHIDPGDLRVRRWGEIADGTTFTSVFKPGQVLFGKRRAYQRKVAVADFEGVCSGDIYVLESANDRLMPELLPFLCQTDAFFDNAVGTSAGSLSPRTNWSSLASFEFQLPPIQEQARIFELLEASRRAIESGVLLLEKLRELRSSLVLAVTGGFDFANNAAPDKPMARLGEVANVVRGSTPRPAGDRRYFGGDHIPWITVGEITKDDGIYLDTTTEFLTEQGKEFSRVVPSGTVVLSNSGWTLGVPKILRITGCANDGVAAFLDLDPKIDPVFLYFRLLGMTEYLRNVIAAGGDQPNLNTERISQLTIPLLSMSDQKEAIDQITAVQSQIENVKLRLKAQRRLQSSMAVSAFVEPGLVREIHRI